MVEDRIDELIRQLGSSDVGVRGDASLALVKIGEPAVSALIEALKDESWVVRERAADALGSIRDVGAVPALVGALNDDVVSVRWKAAEALGSIRDVGAVPALIEVLKGKDTSVQWRAAWALGEIKDAAAVPALVGALNDESWQVRHNVAEALGKIISSLKDIRLRETEEQLMEALKKAEKKEKMNLFYLLEKINNMKNELLAPEAKKLKPPRKTKRRKPKRRIWRAVQG